ncbi:MAG: glycosyltransferase [Acidobacteria bacterium]|nr:MAG: glycosyltransferase [Acidobacteriota bacterium]
MKAEANVKYSIVVPLYNEVDNVPPLYSKITEVMRRMRESYEIIFVDDGSTDETFKVLAEIYDKDGHIVALRLRRNFGQTAALKAGFDLATGEIIISLDGDLQHDPEEIPLFIAKIEEGYDIVSGWRQERTDAWLTRRLPSCIANWTMSKLSGVELHDFGTTFKAYRREIIQDIQLYGELHRFIPALASWSGATVAEIPIKDSPRQNGKSNYGLSRTIRVLLDLISIKFLLDYSTKPLHFFGPLGLIGTSLGTILGVVLVFKKLILGEEIMLQHGPLLFLATLLILTGIQFLSIGLMGEMVARTYYESQKKPIYAVREIKSRRKKSVGAPEQTVKDLSIGAGASFQ